MRAAVLNDRFGLDALRVEQRDDPTPGPGEVLVRLGAATLNYRDLLMVQGQYDPKQPLPLVPCSDGCGTVVALGAGVEGFAVGERVLPSFHQRWSAGPYRPGIGRETLGGPLDGTLRELGCFRADSLVRAPSALDDAQAASLVCAGVTAWNALHAGDRPCGPGDSVVVLGTGGVSLFALQIAQAMGARVLVTSRSAAKLERARALGADATVDTTEQPDWQRSVRTWTDGRGADLVVEVGGAGTLARSLSAVRSGGTIAVIGVLAGRAGELDLAPVLMRAIRLQGIFVGSTADLDALARAVTARDLRPVIDQRFPLEQVPAALAALRDGSHVGKIAIDLAGPA
jgi:NADPH:quinone reductase-like Zn-dependent oxidoreductase